MKQVTKAQKKMLRDNYFSYSDALRSVQLQLDSYPNMPEDEREKLEAEYQQLLQDRKEAFEEWQNAVVVE